MPPINTKKVTDRRQLRFDDLDQIVADARRIAAAERSGTLRRTGNWTAGQTLGHLARWMDCASDGMPEEMRPPWFVKLMFRAMVSKEKFLTGPMHVGVRIPKVEGGTLGTEELPLDEGLARLERSAQRLKGTAPTKPQVFFGPMTHAEWIQLQCRHAELHLSFLHPQGAGPG